jgi:hypothetical protein
VRLTATQVSLIAAAIALAAPAITYGATARLDRARWVRERRAETYIDALAVLGRIAAYVTEPTTRPDPFAAVPGDQWRRFQAQVEAFASIQVIAQRDALLAAWERYQAAPAEQHSEKEHHRTEVRMHYADLISRVREELREGNDPWWRRLLRASPGRFPARSRRTS